MNAARKKPAAPDMGGLKDDWGKLAAMRRDEHDQAPAEPPAPPTPQAATARPTMTRRSWYIEEDAADAFQAAIDDIHFATRVPKNVVAGRLLRYAADHADDVQRDL